MVDRDAGTRGALLRGRGGGPPPVAGQTGGVEERAQEQAGVGLDKKKVVTSVVKVADATLVGGVVAHRGGEVDRRDAAPVKVHGHLCVEVEASSPTDAVQHRKGGDYGVDTEPKKGVPDAAPPCFKVGKPVAEPTSENAQSGRLGSEDGLAENHGGGMFPGCSHETWKIRGFVLIIAIEDGGVRPPLSAGKLQASQHSRTFAAVGAQGQHVESIGRGGQVTQGITAAVGRAVDDDKDGAPLLEDGPDGLVEKGA